MPRRGENIIRRKDGRWEGRYYARICDGKNKRHSVYGHTYSEVKKKLAQKKRESQQLDTFSEMNVAQLMSQWLESKYKVVKHSTYNKYRNLIENHILPRLGHENVGSLNAETIRTYLTAELVGGNCLTKKGVSFSTARDLCVVLKSAMKYGERGIAYPTSLFSAVLHGSCKKTIQTLTLQEQKILEQFLLHDLNEKKLGILLCLHMGLRIGEICALKWNQISIDARTVCIVSTMQRIQNPNRGTPKTWIAVTEPKSKSSIRTIPISDALLPLIQKFAPQNPDCYVLTGSDSRYIEPRNLEYTFQKYLVQCYLPQVHFHTLRHTFATRCMEQNFDIKSLCEILGHSSTKITMDRYVHPTFLQKQLQMNRLTF